MPHVVLHLDAVRRRGSALEARAPRKERLGTPRFWRPAVFAPLGRAIAIMASVARAAHAWDGALETGGAAERLEVDRQWTWLHAPQSWGVFVLLGVLALAAWSVVSIYRRESESCAPRLRWVLAGLRLGTLACVVLVLLGPARVEIVRRTILPPLALLRDASQSMSIADKYADSTLAATAARLSDRSVAEYAAQPATRAELVERALGRDDESLVRRLRERGALRAADFSERSTPVAPTAALDPAGRATDLTQAIRGALEAPAPAAVVLFSDGQHTGRDDPREAARAARQVGAPLLIVGLGDASRPRNLRLANLDVRPQVWKDEPFDLEALVAAQGLAEGETATLEIVEQRVGASGELSPANVVARQTVAIPAGGGQTRQTVSHARGEAGQYVYTARLVPLDGERNAEDNSATSAPVQVLDRESIRVLLIAGGPGWDYQLLERLLARDRTITVSCWLQSLDEERAQAGTHPIGRLPATREELFWYDAIVLLDPDPREFDAAWLELLKQFVDKHAGGVLYMAGPQYSGRMLTMSRAAALRDVLPVRLPDARTVELATLPTSQPRAWPLKIVPGNSDHPLLRLGVDTVGGASKWEQLPGIYWSFPALEPKPTAKLLVEHSDPSLRSSSGPRPLVVAGQFGAGRTLYFGFHGAWRWRSQGRQAEFYDRFWIQAVRHLIEGRALEGRRRGVLRADRERYELGDKVELSAKLENARFEPLDAPQVEAQVSTADRAVGAVTLRAVAGQPGQYVGTFVPKELGRHRVTLELPAEENGEPARTETNWNVELPARESAQPWLNEPLLRDLARLSGGRYFSLAEVEELPTFVPDRREQIELRRPPEPLWDRPWLLAVTILFLGAEWFVRKWQRML